MMDGRHRWPHRRELEGRRAIRDGGRRLAIAALALLVAACGRDGASADESVLRLLLPATERSAWQPLAAAFSATRPGVRVELIEGPNSTDLRESLVSTALLARDPTYDLVYLDVTWTPKFAAAGWLRDLSADFGTDSRERFLAPALAAGVAAGRLYRIPVRTDAGCLYYRADLLAAASIEPPETFAGMAAACRELADPPERFGYVWQGKQYEGLVCNYLEVLAGFGGVWIDAETGHIGLDEPPAQAALEFLVRCARPGGISPPGVLSYQEEESRRLFQEGRAIFLRNWPYVWRLAQRPESALRDRVGVRPMVATSAGRPAATLGGWGLAVSSYSRHPALAVDFIRHVTTIESQRLLCLPTGYAPALRAAYADSELLAQNPFLTTVLELHASAVLRPALVDYARASDILQRRLSAALSGRESVAGALAAAARETRALLAVGGEAPPRSGS